METNAGAYFVGPNNGLPYHLIQTQGFKEGVILDPKQRKTSLSKTSTFDGRDFFAWKAADLSCGVPLRDLGEQLAEAEILQLQISPGEILHIDTVSEIGKFQDIAPHLRASLYQALIARERNLPAELCIDRSGRTQGNAPNSAVKTTHRAHFGKVFGEVPEGEPLVYAGSSFTPEIAVNLRKAASVLDLAIGDRIEIPEWQ